MTRTMKLRLIFALFASIAWTLGPANSVSAQSSVKVLHKTVKVGDLEIFYREAGPKEAPTILLLHGFPTSSQMFRNLIPALGDKYHVNGNAYDEGLDNDFWKPIKAYWSDPKSKEKREALRFVTKYEATKWQYTHGVKKAELISPDGAAHDQFLMDRKGNDEIQLDLLLDYGSNPPLYPRWQAYFRKHQPPMLIAWGKNDQIFPPAGAEPYKRDLTTLHYHLLDAGHFALESNGDEIATLMRGFLGKHVSQK